MKFWAPWVIDLLIALVFVYFFLVGLADGSVSSFNGMLWAGILAFFAILLGGTMVLRAYGYVWTAVLILVLPAIPAIGFLAIMLITLFTNPRWN